MTQTFTYMTRSTGSIWNLQSETRYIYMGNLVIQERDASNNPNVGYTRGNDLSGTFEGAGGIGGLLGRSSGYSAASWSTHHHYHADGGGNVTALVDSSQSISASYRYDSYGNLLSSSGTMAAANLYRFSSKQFQTNSMLYYYGYRFYDPVAQRWLNRDPIGEWGGLNLYNYVANNPVIRIDAFGLCYCGLPSVYPPMQRSPDISPFNTVGGAGTGLFFQWMVNTLRGRSGDLGLATLIGGSSSVLIDLFRNPNDTQPVPDLRPPWQKGITAPPSPDPRLKPFPVAY
jgi:RHS repeat-associated protein